MSKREINIWTIGHSTRTAEEFLVLLAASEIEAVVDVRRFPGSRKYPHFNPVILSESLAQAHIEYVPMSELGGRRRPRTDSKNTVWRNESFRGYADYMETEEFRAGIEKLSELAVRKRAAVMCAEALWWRCHRALIADYLKSQGAIVRHIMSLQKTKIHPFTSAAQIIEGRLSYSEVQAKSKIAE